MQDARGITWQNSPRCSKPVPDPFLFALASI